MNAGHDQERVERVVAYVGEVQRFNKKVYDMLVLMNNLFQDSLAKPKAELD